MPEQERRYRKKGKESRSLKEGRTLKEGKEARLGKETRPSKERRVGKEGRVGKGLKENSVARGKERRARRKERELEGSTPLPVTQIKIQR